MPAKAKTQKLKFDDIARLTDREIQMTWREVDTVDLAMALVGAKKSVLTKSFANVSNRVETMLKEEMAFLGTVPKGDITKVRVRIADVLNKLHGAGLITWPPEKLEGKKKKLDNEYLQMKENAAAQAKRPLSDMSFEEIDGLFADLSEIARSEGIMALETIITTIGDPFLGSALRLAVDGTEPELVMNILQNYMRSQIQEQSVKLRKAMEGVMSIQSGDNPRIVQQKLSVLY